MIFTKKNRELIRQNETNTTKSQKHEVNLQKNSSFYFQVGLIICLLITYSLFEISFKTNEIAIADFPDLQEDDIYVYNVPIKIFEDIKQIERKKSKPLVLNNPVITDNDNPMPETPNVVLEPTTKEPPIDPNEIILEENPDILTPVNIMAVEQVPIFPGCEDAVTNEARRQCMSDKIATHIKKKFNADLAYDIGLKGEQKIYVMFKIDKHGYVKDIKTNSDYSKLDKEAERVIGKLPQMTPGKQKDKNVEVVYSIPIKFHVIN